MEDISILANALTEGRVQACGINSGGTILFNHAASRPKLRQIRAITANDEAHRMA